MFTASYPDPESPRHGLVDSRITLLGYQMCSSGPDIRYFIVTSDNMDIQV